MLYDGWWRAIEIDAASMFSVNEIDADFTILVTEFCYANEAVHMLNNGDGYMAIMSLLDSRKGGGSIKGDGSTPDITVSEFDQ